MSTLLILSSGLDLAHLVQPLRDALPGMTVAVWPDAVAEDVVAALCWRPPAGVLATLPRLALIHSVAAGVDHILADPRLPDLPLCRIVDPSLTAGMVEYILWSVLYFHRRFDVAARQQGAAVWRHVPRVPAGDFTVGLLGLGEIGGAAADRLARLGYRVRGWSRTARRIDGVDCFAGPAELDDCIGPCDLVVSVLPTTPETLGLLDARFFARCKPGTALVNCGRGEQLVLGDLRDALDAGRLRGAVLDVFDVEPLPADHWLWRDGRVVITPHMASYPLTADVIAQVAANVDRLRAGLPLHHTVPRDRGY